LKRLLGLIRSNRGGATSHFQPCAPESPVQIIGDIHGRHDAFTELVERLDPDKPIVTVGDYIDRGDQSAQVLTHCMEANENDRDQFICLLGNHEQMLLNFLENPAQESVRWLRQGGLQTLASFGVSGATPTLSNDAAVAVRDALRQKMPAGMEEWLRLLPSSWNSGNLWVVHAAADPQVDMAQQSPETLVWGHKDFLRTVRNDGEWVAHGHTIVDTPIAASGRIAVDTGAYFTGVLTAAICHPDRDIAFINNRALA